MDYDNPSHLAEYLHFVSKHPLNLDSVEKIVSSLNQHEAFDVKTARKIIWSICDMEVNEIFRPLMKKAIDCMIIHWDELSFDDMKTILKKLISRCSKKASYFYDETFYDSCANHVIDKDLGYECSLSVLQPFGHINFFHKYLLDYVSKKVCEDPKLMSSCACPEDIYSVAFAASMTDYRPVHWDTLKSIIAKYRQYSRYEVEMISLKFAASVCLLDIFDPLALRRCLAEDFLKELTIKERSMPCFENLATIWHCIKLFKPELSRMLLPTYDPQLLVNSYKQNLTFPLEPALHKALGGKNYVKTDLYSKLGIQIDHAVVFTKGGYPVAMNCEDVQFIEDISVAPDNQLVAILGLRHYNYTLNNRKLRESTNVAITLLGLQVCQVVPICLEAWEQLPESEKIPYVMRTIKERTY